jgi:catalase
MKLPLQYDAGQKDRLTTNLAKSLGMAKQFIQDRYIANLEKVDSAYADMVRSKIAAMR